MYVTGGQDITVTSTAAASMLSNVRFEVIGYTNLVLDVPDLTMTGIYRSVSGPRSCLPYRKYIYNYNIFLKHISGVRPACEYLVQGELLYTTH